MSEELGASLAGDGWWLRKHGKERGPMSSEVLRSLIKDGLVQASDFVRGPNFNEWTKLEDIAATPPSPAETQSHSPPADPSIQVIPAAISETAQGTVEIVKKSLVQETGPLESPAGPETRTSSVGPGAITQLDEDISYERTKGRIKFFDPKTKKWGKILPEDAQGDAFYRVDDIIGGYTQELLEGSEVEFLLGIGPKGRLAKQIVILKSPESPILQNREPMRARRIPATRTELDRSPKGKWIRDWAAIPFFKPHIYDEERYENVLHALADIALPEKWYLGEKADDREFPLLRKYIYATFERVKHEGKILIKQHDGQWWAVFNTGLVDKVYDPIYMLFVESNGERPWRLVNICIEGKRGPGKKLAELFSPCPPAATYLEKASDLIIEPGADVLIDDEHVIDDAIKHDRYPAEFLKRYSPHGLEWEDYTRYPEAKKDEFLAKFAYALAQDMKRYRDIKRRIEEAIDLAKKRTFWNYKTAIPSYYPKINRVQLLLPLCLDEWNDNLVSAALVVSRNPSGSYQGRTVYPLDWAYEQARVVCRPDSDWLIPEKIVPRPTFANEEVEGGDDEKAAGSNESANVSSNEARPIVAEFPTAP